MNCRNIVRGMIIIKGNANQIRYERGINFQNIFNEKYSKEGKKLQAVH